MTHTMKDALNARLLRLAQRGGYARLARLANAIACHREMADGIRYFADAGLEAYVWLLRTMTVDYVGATIGITPYPSWFSDPHMLTVTMNESFARCLNDYTTVPGAMPEDCPLLYLNATDVFGEIFDDPADTTTSCRMRALACIVEGHSSETAVALLRGTKWENVPSRIWRLVAVMIELFETADWDDVACCIWMMMETSRRITHHPDQTEWVIRNQCPTGCSDGIPAGPLARFRYHCGTLV